MFTCSVGEELLFPTLDDEQNNQKQEFNLLNARCKKLENDIQKYNEIRKKEKLEYEKQINLIIKDKENELHRLGTCHAINIHEIENKYINELENYIEELNQLKLELQEKSSYIILQTDEIQTSRVKISELELTLESELESKATTLELNTSEISSQKITIDLLQSKLITEAERIENLTQENESLLETINLLQNEKDALNKYVSQ